MNLLGVGTGYRQVACEDTNPEVFFPLGGGAVVKANREEYRAKVTAAKVICGRCHARQRCLQYALDNREWGIWGGTTEADRARINGHGPAAASRRVRKETA